MPDRHDDNHTHSDMTEFPIVHKHEHLINKPPRRQIGSHNQEHRHEGVGDSVKLKEA